jgi:hypothetical protein
MTVTTVLLLSSGGFVFGLAVGFVCGRIIPEKSNVLDVTLAVKEQNPEAKKPEEKGRKAR